MSALRRDDVGSTAYRPAVTCAATSTKRYTRARMPRQRDFLDELDAERSAANPAFPAILAAARERRALIAQLAAKRRELNIPQADVARRMGAGRIEPATRPIPASRSSRLAHMAQ